MVAKAIPNRSPIDFGLNKPVRNFVAELLASDPSATEGRVHYDTVNHLLKYGDNSAIRTIASKSYVDSLVTAAQNNWTYKKAVRAAIGSNVDLSSALVDGASLGGVTLATGDRVLPFAQTDASENGIYIVAASGAASRSTDADSSVEVTSGMHVEATEGTYQGVAFLLDTADPIVLGTTDLTFIDITGAGSTYTADVAIDLTAGAFSAKFDDATVGVNGSNQLYIKNAGVSEVQLNSSVAGAGLTGGAGSPLAVNPDGTTLENSSDQVRVKDLGISTAKIAAGAVTGAKLDSGIFGTGLSFSAGVASVNYATGVFSSSFNSTTDWGSVDGDGQYTITIAAATHGFGTAVSVRDILSDDGTNFVVSPIYYQIVKASGDVSFTADTRFAGKIIVERLA